MDAVREYAQRCHQREFMGGFHEGTISNGGHPFHLGTSECAIVEIALQHIESNKSLLIHNPFPTTALPVALMASYAYSQHPRIPDGEGKSMLVFPASSRGYLSELDAFHFSHTPHADDNKTPLIPRTPIDSVSELSSEWGIYTAKSGFVFDVESDTANIGALFVDLQKPEWSERAFDRIEEFCESHPDIPTVFYTTDREIPAAKLTCDRLGTDPLQVTNEFLASAPHTDPEPGESDLTTQERILTNGGVEMLQFPVTDTELGESIPEFIELKKKCQEQDLAYVEVARVFNRLTKQPFKPEYWTRTVGSHGHYDDVPGYIDRLKSRASHLSSGSDLLYNYARLANEIQGYLNDQHALQNTVLDAIQRAGQDTGDSVFVVKNTAEKDALRLAATDSGYTIPDNVEIIEHGNISPNPDVRYVFVYPPYSDDYVYEFPPSKKVAFIHNALWSTYVQSSAKDATQEINASHKTTSIGAGGTVGDVDDHVFDIDSLESDISSYLRRTDFGTDTETDADTTTTTPTGTEDTLVFHLSNGEQKTVAPTSIVTIYDSDTARTTRKKAKSVTTGDEILLINSVADDLYDVLLESAHRRQAVRDDEALVENWRATLDSGMDRKGMSASDVVTELGRHGSNIESTDSVNAWRVGRYMGPDDEGDCRRILHIFRPELEGELLEQIHEQVWKAMKHLRLLHRRIGRNIRRAVEAEFNPSTRADFTGDVNERMIRNISQEIEKQTVVEITQDAAN